MQNHDGHEAFEGTASSKLRWFELVMQHSMDGINVSKVDTRTWKRTLVLCNDRYVEMSGRSRRELMTTAELDRHVRELEAKETFPVWAMEGRPGRGLSSWLRPDGKENFYEWMSVPLYIDDEMYIVGIDRDVTETKKAQESLRQAAGKLQEFESIINRSPVYVFVWRIEEGWPVEFASKNVSHLGYTAEDFVSGRVSWVGVTHPDDVPRLEQEVSGFLRDGRDEFEQEYRLLTASGEVRHVMDRNRVLRDAEGNAERIQGILFDVTERRRAEHALERSEEMFRALLEHVPGVAIQGYETDGTVRYWNKASESLYGYSAAEAVGKDLGDLIIPPEIKPLYQQGLQLGAKAERSGEFLPSGEHRLLRKDGSRVLVYSMHTAVRLAGHDPLLFCIDVDLTERKRAEEELRQERDFAQSLVDTAPSIVMVLDEQGRVTRFNRFGQELTGYGEEEVLGKNWFESFLPDSVRDVARRQFGQLLDGGCSQDASNSIVTKDGREIIIQWYPKLLQGADGKPAGVLAIGHDITEMRRKEAQFLQAQKMEAVGRLVGGVAHDFNNQLTIIKGYCDLLMRRMRASNPIRSHVNEIRTAAVRSASLIGQLLAFSRKQFLLPQVVNIRDLIEEMSDLLKTMIHEDIGMSLIAEPGLGLVRVDPMQFRQAVMNLVVNARDAMPDGGQVTLEMSNVTLDEDHVARHMEAAVGPHVVLTVRDTGHGMEAKTLSQVFEPFFTTKPVGQGTGLGLAMVYGFVQQSGGHVTVDSSPGEGATFRIYLPRVQADSAGQPAPEPLAPEPPHGSTILLVQKNRSARDLTAQDLRQRGYEVLEASKAAEAVKLANQHADSIRLLIADALMPGMDGPELAGNLRTRLGDLPVIYLADRGQGIDLGERAAGPLDCVLIQPVPPGELERQVRTLLARAR